MSALGAPYTVATLARGDICASPPSTATVSVGQGVFAETLGGGGAQGEPRLKACPEAGLVAAIEEDKDGAANVQRRHVLQHPF